MQATSIMVPVPNTPTGSNTDSKMFRTEVDFPGSVGRLPIFSTLVGVFGVGSVGMVVVAELVSVGMIGVVGVEVIGIVGV